MRLLLFDFKWTIIIHVCFCFTASITYYLLFHNLITQMPMAMFYVNDLLTHFSFKLLWSPLPTPIVFTLCYILQLFGWLFFSVPLSVSICRLLDLLLLLLYSISFGSIFSGCIRLSMVAIVCGRRTAHVFSQTSSLRDLAKCVLRFILLCRHRLEIDNPFDL